MSKFPSVSGRATLAGRIAIKVNPDKFLAKFDYLGFGEEDEALYHNENGLWTEHNAYTAAKIKRGRGSTQSQAWNHCCRAKH